jgi:dephospho-CoA kinase
MKTIEQMDKEILAAIVAAHPEQRTAWNAVRHGLVENARAYHMGDFQGRPRDCWIEIDGISIDC